MWRAIVTVCVLGCTFLAGGISSRVTKAATSASGQPQLKEWAQITCPTSNVCAVAGQSVATSETPYVIAVTQDAGASWTVVRRAPRSIDGIACPTSRVCYALQRVSDQSAHRDWDAIIKTVDGGQTWHRAKVRQVAKSEHITWLYQISCASPSECVLGNGFSWGATQQQDRYLVLFMNQGGRSWDVWKYAAPLGLRIYVSCFTANHCYLMDNRKKELRVTFNHGRTFEQLAYPDANTNEMYGPICASATTCFLFGLRSRDKLSVPGIHCPPCKGTIYKTSDGGKTWQLEYSVMKSTSGSTFDGWATLGCFGPANCFVSLQWGHGHGPTLMQWNGRAWHGVHVFPQIFPESMECPSTSRCFLVAIGSGQSSVMRTDNGGKTWQKVG